MVGRKYRFSFVDEYEKAISMDKRLANRLYWDRILHFSHLVSGISLSRTLHWINGVYDALGSGNSLTFAANLRGMLEATADTVYSLKPAASTLAKFRHKIQTILSDECSRCEDELVTSPLMDKLHHFMFASNLKKIDPGELDGTKALTTRRYLEELQGSVAGPVLTLYAELCELTHPAHGSVKPFYDSVDGTTVEIVAPFGRDWIDAFCVEHSKGLVWMTAGINCCLLTLATINEYNIAEFTVDLGGFNVAGMPGWSTVKELFDTAD
jgi:hypothetical protein